MDTKTMTNSDRVRLIVDDAFNNGNLAVLPELAPISPVPVVDGGEPVTAAALQGMVSALRLAFPDLHLELRHVMEDGDWVSAQALLTGTHQGPIGTPLIPRAAGDPLLATGRAVRLNLMILMRFAGGMNCERHLVVDRALLMMQLGLIPDTDRHASA